MRNTPKIFSWFSHLKRAIPDPIFGVSDAFSKDTNPKKVNLGVGSYMDDDCNPYVLPSVIKAEQKVHEKSLDHEYSPASGCEEFCDLTIRLALGDTCPQLHDGLTTTVQGISGTGSLKLGAKFLKTFFPYKKEVYVPCPSWTNYNLVFLFAGMEIKPCRYYKPDTCGLDFEGFLEDINQIPKQSIILLQPCGQNPTGVDLQPEQWQELSHIIKKRRLFPFFDMAYQGLATGDVFKDSYAVRLFLQDGHQMALSQSYSKNMGLYGERVGAFSLVNSSKEEAEVTLSQLSTLVQGSYGSPPIHGARIVMEILGNQDLRLQWLNEVKNMVARMISMRKALRHNLEKGDSARDWSHITDQIGMFCYTGLQPPEVKQLATKFSIYLPEDGRMSMGGVTPKNVDYIAHGIYQVTKKSENSRKDLECLTLKNLSTNKHAEVIVPNKQTF